jgi:hypothetical protein
LFVNIIIKFKNANKILIRNKVPIPPRKIKSSPAKESSKNADLEGYQPFKATDFQIDQVIISLSFGVLRSTLSRKSKFQCALGNFFYDGNTYYPGKKKCILILGFWKCI